MTHEFTSFLTVFQSYKMMGDSRNERLCATEPHLWFERYPPLVGLKPKTAIPTASADATEPLGVQRTMVC